MEESHVFITRAFHYQTALNRHILCLSTPAEIEGDFSHLLIKFHAICKSISYCFFYEMCLWISLIRLF